MIKVLDLFCGAGGATVGFQRAGFDVVGIDVNPQPDYPGTFIQADIRDVTRFTLQGFDYIHASPPCQRNAAITKGTNQHLRHRYPDYYPLVSRLLTQSGLPFSIENPVARADMVLCGEMFGLQVIRHRNFELGNWTASAPTEPKHRGRVKGMRHGVWYEGYYYAVYGCGGGKGSVPEWQSAMDIHWTNNRKSIAEAIPPAYTEYVGTQFATRTMGVAA